MQANITQLEAIINQYSPLLNALDEAKASYKPFQVNGARKNSLATR